MEPPTTMIWNADPYLKLILHPTIAPETAQTYLTGVPHPPPPGVSIWIMSFFFACMLLFAGSFDSTRRLA